jgi:hypothetical protein
MPTPFREFAVKEIAHAKQVIEWMDSGEWEESPELRRHYLAVIEALEGLLGKDGGS